MNYLKKFFIVSLLLLSLLSNSIVYSKKNPMVLTLSEKKVFYREMVNYDIAIRNAISYFALGYPNNSLKAYRQMNKLNSLEHPKLRSNMRSIIRKLKKNNTFQYIKNIQFYANKNINSIQKSLKDKKSINWQYIIKNLNTISNNCKSCHNNMDITIKELKKKKRR